MKDVVDGWMGTTGFHNGAFPRSGGRTSTHQEASRKSDTKWWSSPSTTTTHVFLAAGSAGELGRRTVSSLAEGFWRKLLNTDYDASGASRRWIGFWRRSR